MAFIDQLHRRLETAILALMQTVCGDRRCKSVDDLQPWPPRDRFALLFCARCRRRKTAALKARKA